MRPTKLAGTLALATLTLLTFGGSDAEAHGRPRYYRYYRYRYPYYRAYYPYYSYFPAFGYYYGGFYPYGYPVRYGPYDQEVSLLRIEVKPVEAEVYVDGYLAGSVDEFDGFFQRLRLEPGSHEITLYLDGHRPIRETLYLSPGQSYKIRRAMEPLAEGEAAEPRPEPPAKALAAEKETQPSVPASGFGVLELQMQPPGAEVFIDGDPWPTEGPAEELVIHLSVGEHQVEIRTPGHEAFTTAVTVRAGKTTSLNVKLED